ncbi:hypothetical protein KKG22_03080 [Patescibacteria group bacterium]|nr:hypothetical protein [Patescibacteria group bacterium]MBU1721361.1 hypothetical protein [Patescibacteria group bacterium]
MKKITLLEKGRTLGKKAMYTGIILFALGIIIYLLQNSEMSNILIAITVLSYFLVWWGGSTWLFCHSLKGYIERKMIVIGDEIEPETEYTGTAAKIYGVIGVVLAVFFFLLSLIPVVVLMFDK